MSRKRRWFGRWRKRSSRKRQELMLQALIRLLQLASVIIAAYYGGGLGGGHL